MSSERERAGVEFPLVPADEYNAGEETKIKTELLRWANDIADEVIKAVLDDVALRFFEVDSDDDEQSGSLDLVGDYDPVVDSKTGSRLSEAIKHAAETLRTSEKILRHCYISVLKQKWANHPKKIPSEPTGKFYGRCLVNRHGVWSRRGVAELDDLYVWRRIAKTRIDPEALSYDTSGIGTIDFSSPVKPGSFQLISTLRTWAKKRTLPSTR